MLKASLDCCLDVGDSPMVGLHEMAGVLNAANSNPILIFEVVELPQVPREV